MQKIIEGCSLVMLGSWNPRIFTPQWISNGRLTSQSEVMVEVSFDNLDLPIRYAFDDIRMTVSERNIIIAPTSPDDSLMLRIEDVAKKILKDLPHTPLSAIGVNFKFNESDYDESIVDDFQFKDINALSDEEYEIQESSIVRKINWNGVFINFVLFRGYQRSDIDLSFNFHKDIKNLDEALSLIDGKVIEYSREADKISSLYKKKEV
jgi:hypothetical protein